MRYNSQQTNRFDFQGVRVAKDTVVPLKPRTQAQKDKKVVNDKATLSDVVKHMQQCAGAKRTAVLNHEDWGFLSIQGKAWMFNLHQGAAALIATEDSVTDVNPKDLKLTHKLTLAIGYEISADALDQSVVIDFTHKKDVHSYRVPEAAMKSLLAAYCVKKGCNLSLVL